MEEIILSFVNYLKQFSYFGIIIALTFEFVPAEIVLPLTGYWVYNGDFNYVLAVIAGTIGGTTGPLTLYALGYYGGRPFLEKYGKYFFIKNKQLDSADHFFQKYGAFVAFLGRFIPGVRTVISIPCGVAKMNVWIFSFYTFIAMLPITAIYIYVGVLLGEHWHKASEIVSRYMLPLGIGIVAVIVVTILYKWLLRQRRRFT